MPNDVLDRPRRWKSKKQQPLGILVLPRQGARPLFYYEPGLEEEEEPAERDAPITTAAGVKSRMRRVMKGVNEAEHHAPQWVRTPIRWLKSKLPADERLLMALRGAHAATLIHPSSMSGEDAVAAWSGYLDSRFRERVAWLVFYLVLLVPSVMLTVVPGPNVLGLWVAYRLIAHGIALYGIGRAKRGRVTLACEANEALDGPVVSDRKEAARVQEHFNLIGLKGRLKRERVVSRLRTRRQRAPEDASTREDQR